MPDIAEVINVKTVGLVVFVLIIILGLKWCGGRDNFSSRKKSDTENTSTTTTEEKKE